MLGVVALNNQEKHGQYHQQPLVDVVGTYFDGRVADEEADLCLILDCMWDLEKAADLAAPDVVEPDFKTTVDDTEWRG